MPASLHRSTATEMHKNLFPGVILQLIKNAPILYCVINNLLLVRGISGHHYSLLSFRGAVLCRVLLQTLNAPSFLQLPLPPGVYLEHSTAAVKARTRGHFIPAYLIYFVIPLTELCQTKNKYYCKCEL